MPRSPEHSPGELNSRQLCINIAPNLALKFNETLAFSAPPLLQLRDSCGGVPETMR
ncbi:GM18423 [Drosophila sechellia]|uniref:GD23243 n=2 Tax=melanogaster subgroup TaxID=32351 RepID=B4Q9M5_DROSI|nr:GM18423 [Drosophila sechellia]EDX03636.1 GD23243 [Drosophila simulans]